MSPLLPQSLFNVLPTELKIKIFVLDTLPINRSHPHYLKLRTRAMKLGNVCHEWREIVWSIPQLWSNINVDFILYHHNKEYLDLYFKNSTNYPLDVSITFSYRESDIAKSCEVLDDLCREGHRLQTLHISFGTRHRFDLGKVKWHIKQLANSHLPVLETVELECEDTDGIFTFDMNEMFSDSPRLRMLSLKGISLSSGPLSFPSVLSSFKEVKKMELRRAMVDLCIYAIVDLPNLTHLTVESIRYNQNLILHPTSRLIDPAFIHSSLTSLEITIDDSSGSLEGHLMLIFFAQFLFPALRKFCVNIINSNSASVEIYFGGIVKLLNTWNCPLEELKIEMDYFPADIWMLFDCVHITVQSLQLTNRCVESDIIHALVEKLASPFYFPRIEKLEIFQLSRLLSYDFIIRQLKQRMESWPSVTNIRPSTFKVVLEYVTPPFKFAEEYNDTESDAGSNLEEIKDNVILREMKERGMDVSFNVKSRGM